MQVPIRRLLMPALCALCCGFGCTGSATDGSARSLNQAGGSTSVGTNGGGSSTGSGPAPVPKGGTSTGASTGSGTTSGGGTPGPTPLYSGMTPLTAEYTFRGRFDMSNPNQPRMQWNNSAIGFQVTGTTQVTAALYNVDNSNPYNFIVVLVDGVAVNKLTFTAGVTSYPVATHLSTGPHTIWLSKGQEYNYGPIGFGGVTLDAGGQLLAPPPAAAKRILFMGSSTLSGWDEDANPANDPNGLCSSSLLPGSNAEESIPAYAAYELGADFQNISSGAGGILETFSQGASTLPQRYTQVTSSAPAPWNAALWRPDVVVIEAGGSDFAIGDGPPAQLPVGQLEGYPTPQATAVQTYTVTDFYNAFRAFIVQLRADSPGVTVVLVNTKDMNGQSTQLLFSTMDQLAASFTDGKVLRYDYYSTDVGLPACLYTDWYSAITALGSSCLQHPNPASSKYFADRLARFIKKSVAGF